MKFLEIRCPTLWMWCLLALIAVGCGEAGGSEPLQSDVNYAPIQESRIEESLDVEFRTGFRKSDKDNKSVAHQEGGDSDSAKEVLDVIVEEVEEGHREMTFGPQEEPELESVGQQVVGQVPDSLRSDIREQVIGNGPEFLEVPPILGSVEQQVDDSADDLADRWLEAQQFYGLPGRLALDDRTKGNTVKLIVDSLTLDNCVVRGEILNHSDDLYARNVTVMMGALDDKDNATWNWPLTMKPGESAPFEIEITWPPHSFNYDREMSSFDALKLFGNTSIGIKAELSPNPDIGRAFVINYDGTEPENIFMKGENSHRYPVYDERALELQSSSNFLWAPSAYSPTSKEIFAQIFPDELVISNDIEPIIAGFIPYDYTDIYYVPSVLYPDAYEENESNIATDIRIYQTYKQGSRIIDVWKLVPHSVSEEIDAEGLVNDRRFVPVTDLLEHGMGSSERAYIRLLYPGENGWDPDSKFYNFPERNVDGFSSLHRDGWGFGIPSYEEIYEQLWVGSASHSRVNSTVDPLLSLPKSGNESCASLGGLSRTDYYWEGESRTKVHAPLGYDGVFGRFQVGGNAAEDVYVDLGSVRIDSDIVRGLLHNASDKNYARDVIVSARHRGTGVVLGTWHWPLSVQPGERAPFEIPNFESDLGIEQIEFQVTAMLSEHPDLSRSFLISFYSGGTVAGEEYMGLLGSQFNPDYQVKPGYYLSKNAIWYPPYSRYTKREFVEIYGDIVSSSQIDEMELFTFLDMYARLTPPNSHPELARMVTTQYIHNLRAYAAILDDELKVVDVVDLPVFTPVYGQANLGLSNVEVSTIPAPNRWSPNAVRLLKIIPYEDIEELKSGYRYQVWIGGTAEPIE